MKFKVWKRTSEPLQRTGPPTSRPRPLSFTYPLHLLPSGNKMRDNTINHSLRAARWARGGGKWKRAQGKGLQFRNTNWQEQPSPCQRTGQVPAEDSKGTQGCEMEQKMKMRMGGGGSELRRALAKAETRNFFALFSKKGAPFQMGPIEAGDSWDNLCAS